jgi:hypothetical protein
MHNRNLNTTETVIIPTQMEMKCKENFLFKSLMRAIKMQAGRIGIFL